MKSFAKQLVAYSIRSAVIFSLRAYQKVLSPDHGLFQPLFGNTRCRFYPSCSEYALRSIRQHGLLKGGVVSVKRVLRCNPWHKGGYDPVPE